MLCFVTNRKLVASEKFLPIIAQVIAAGVDLIILREKDLATEELLPLARKIKAMTDETNTELIINGNLAVAQNIQAQGYHIGFARFMDRGREFAGKCGVSVHNVAEAIAAAREGADYLLAGHIFPTECKPGLPPRGLELIREIKEKVAIPLIGIGGITPENYSQVINAGAHGIAVMSTIMTAHDPQTMVKAYRQPC